MKNTLQAGLIAVLGFALGWVLPWWGIAAGGFIGGAAVKGTRPFLTGFLSLGGLWLILAWKLETSSPSRLGEKVAAIFNLNSLPLLLLVTFLVGGLVGGLSSLSGSLLRNAVSR
jgi:hypothetical protein